MPLSNSPEYIALAPSAIEERAIMLRWQKIEYQSGPIDSSDAIRLLKEMRQRMTQMEEEAVVFGVKQMSEARRTPRRKQQMALLAAVIVIPIIIAIIVMFK